jgi:hypothetical protein
MEGSMNLIDPQNLWNAALAHPQSNARMSLQLPRADGIAPAETNDGALDENCSIALELREVTVHPDALQSLAFTVPRPAPATSCILSNHRPDAFSRHRR